jgi:hypothetical protein
MSLPAPNFDVTSGIAAPAMPGWAYIPGLKDTPISEFVSPYPGSKVILSNKVEVIFAPTEYKGRTIGLFATNLPWVIRELNAAAPMTVGGIINSSNDVLPSPAYIDFLMTIRYVKSDEQELHQVQGSGGASVFADQLGMSKGASGHGLNMGLTTQQVYPSASTHTVEEAIIAPRAPAVFRQELPETPLPTPELSNSITAEGTGGSLAATLSALQGTTAKKK